MGHPQTWRCSVVRGHWSRNFPLLTVKYFRGANPSYAVDELLYQLTVTRAVAMIVHADSLDVAVKAASKAGISQDRIILLEKSSTFPNQATVQNLVDVGLRRDAAFIERRLAPGEAKTKIAFLSFSSGTTGRPKVSLCLSLWDECISLSTFCRPLQYPTSHLLRISFRWLHITRFTKITQRGKNVDTGQEI
jgi:acyl-CoA synthetase (AMP-forming)/AMP-acid ligase II